MHGWAVVIAKPNSEAIAVANLQRQGYSCYFPRFRERKPNNLVAVKPLFPRYIFCHVEQIWYSIKGTRGVSTILHGEFGPQIIPTSIVDAIRAREDAEGFVLVGRQERTDKFEKGQPVKTLDGPLAGLSMIYEGMSAKDRVRVLADMLGRKVSITVKESGLIAA